MSEKPSEYLKRTCLICGCHTNQTINIYEPRSGPNIVQLIQAKFKFQPLNEDKYLCFSCNNWLINWHSLQALNSNDAESPSGTFRSHMNSMVSEKGAGSQQQMGQKEKQQSQQHHQKQSQEHHQEQSQQQQRVCRPVAHVRPRQLETNPTIVPAVSSTVVHPTTAPTQSSSASVQLIPAQPNPAPAQSTRTQAQVMVKPMSSVAPIVARPSPPSALPPSTPPPSAAAPKSPKGLNFYAKRSFRPTLNRLSRRNRLKSMQTCCVCGRSIVIRVGGTRLGGVAVTATSASASSLVAKSTTAKCRKCREVCKWRTIYLSSLARAERRAQPLVVRARPQQQQQLQPHQQQQQNHQQQIQHHHQHQSLVNANEAAEISSSVSQAPNPILSHSQSQSTNFRHFRPRVDGKVVSMLRRLGTTLSREPPQSSENHTEQQQEQEPHSTTTTTTSTMTTSSSSKLPPIMSPAKKRPQWTRPLEDDEILLDFDTAISEVLPVVAAQQQQQRRNSDSGSERKQTRRKLTYQMTSVEAIEVEDEDENDVIDLSEDSSDDDEDDEEMEEGESEMEEGESEMEEGESEMEDGESEMEGEEWNPLESIYSIIPKGLSVSLI